jgi:hypothetical protein
MIELQERFKMIKDSGKLQNDKASGKIQEDKVSGR